MTSKRRRFTLDLVEEAKRRAHKKAGVPYTPVKRDSDFPLVPVFIGVDKDNIQIREQFLWKFGAPGVDQLAVASKLCSELHLPANCERFLEEQVAVGLRNYKTWKPTSGEKLVRFQIYVRHGDQALHDEVEWDLNNPQSTPEVYANVVCSSLNLTGGWFKAIVRTVQGILDDYHQDLLAFPKDVQLLPPLKSGVRAVKGEVIVPRLEPYSEEEDREHKRRQSRQERASARKLQGTNTTPEQQRESKQPKEEKDVKVSSSLPSNVPTAPASARSPSPESKVEPLQSQPQPTPSTAVPTSTPSAPASRLQPDNQPPGVKSEALPTSSPLPFIQAAALAPLAKPQGIWPFSSSTTHTTPATAPPPTLLPLSATAPAALTPLGTVPKVEGSRPTALLSPTEADPSIPTIKIEVKHDSVKVDKVKHEMVIPDSVKHEVVKPDSVKADLVKEDPVKSEPGAASATERGLDSLSERAGVSSSVLEVKQEDGGEDIVILTRAESAEPGTGATAAGRQLGIVQEGSRSERVDVELKHEHNDSAGREQGPSAQAVMDEREAGGEGKVTEAGQAGVMKGTEADGERGVHGGESVQVSRERSPTPEVLSLDVAAVSEGVEAVPGAGLTPMDIDQQEEDVDITGTVVSGGESKGDVRTGLERDGLQPGGPNWAGRESAGGDQRVNPDAEEAEIDDAEWQIESESEEGKERGLEAEGEGWQSGRETDNRAYQEGRQSVGATGQGYDGIGYEGWEGMGPEGARGEEEDGWNMGHDGREGERPQGAGAGEDQGWDVEHDGGEGEGWDSGAGFGATFDEDGNEVGEDEDYGDEEEDEEDEQMHQMPGVRGYEGPMPSQVKAVGNVDTEGTDDWDDDDEDDEDEEEDVDEEEMRLQLGNP